MRGIVALALALAGCGATPGERSTLELRSQNRVDCPAPRSQTQERDGHYAVDVCGYRFSYHCHADHRGLYYLGDRVCDDAPAPEEQAEHIRLTARRVVAADGQCPLESLVTRWLGPGPEERSLVRVEGCGRAVRLLCRPDAVKVGDCSRLSFADASRLDAGAAAREAFAAGHGCDPAEVRELAWGTLEPTGGAPVWSLVLGGCGASEGYLCRRVDPERDEAADCHPVPIDADRALAAARAAYSRAARCAPTRAETVRAGYDNTPRREVWADVGGCAGDVLYRCAFADLLAAEPTCWPLDAAHHPAFQAALRDASAAEIDHTCDSSVSGEGRRGDDWTFDIKACGRILAYACRYDARADRAACGPDAPLRAEREAAAAAAARHFAAATACPEREVRVFPAWPYRASGGWSFQLLGCDVRRDLTCNAAGRCAATSAAQPSQPREPLGF